MSQGITRILWSTTKVGEILTAFCRSKQINITKHLLLTEIEQEQKKRLKELTVKMLLYAKQHLDGSWSKKTGMKNIFIFIIYIFRPTFVL